MATLTTAGTFGTYTTGETVDIFKHIFDGLATVGLTQTADTGQLNLTTAPAAVFSSASYSYGYTVHRFNDTYQSTYPIYIRIDYLNANITSTTVMKPTFKFTVGTSTNGAGVIGGDLDSQTFTFSASSTTDRTTRYSFLCYKDHNLSILINDGSGIAGVTQYLAIGRLINTNGVIINGYVKTNNLWSAGTGHNWYDTVVQPTKTARHFTTNSGQSPYFIPHQDTWSPSGLTVGADIPVFPYTILTPDYVTATHMLCTTSNVTNGNTFTSARLGRTYTYRGTNVHKPNSYTYLTNCMIWE